MDKHPKPLLYLNSAHFKQGQESLERPAKANQFVLEM